MNAKASLFASVALIVGASAAFAAEPPSGTPAAPSREMREKMAVMHEKLAACLRSDKPIADCRKEAMSYHQEMMGTMGKGGCPMMDMGDHEMPKQPGKTEPAAQK
jgi:hypothetical protein